MATNSHANDAMIRRLEKELEERNSAIQGIISNAQDAERDLNDAEKETLNSMRDRMGQLKDQIDQLESVAESSSYTANRMKQLDQALTTARKTGSSEVQYRSAGAYALDAYQAAIGSREAAERIEVFHRTAEHQKTADNLGVVPDPIVGDVVNFIDAARPVVSWLGPQAITSQKWYRPKVTQHTSVAAQGSAGAAADEKTELESQKMTITRLDATAVTYGGYVNVSRQNIDFSSPQILDLVINDLAAQYAIQTEAATGTTLAATSATAVEYTEDSADSLASAVWTAAANVYSAVKGQGRLAIAVSSSVLQQFGPLFAPYNPRDSQSPGMEAGRFGQGVMGTISGIPVVMSAGIGTGEAYLFSSAALEVFEQRVGTLQVIEPSVLGVQVAYAGYFTPLIIENNGIVPLEIAS